MVWYELIRISTTAERATELVAALTAMAGDLRKMPGVTSCSVMRHALYDGHLAVALTHRDAGDARPTKEALALADYLRGYGLVDHQVWLAAGPDDQRVAAPVAEASPARPERQP